MGALNGVKVIEMAGIGPAPFCGMLLADMGAEVLRIDRLVASDIGIPVPPKFDLLNRNKRSVALDLKSNDSCVALLRLIAGADILIGGIGNDLLLGDSTTTTNAAAGDDFLDGGPGNDLGNGGVGTDECVQIERRRACEL